jgi:hypothetical protein
MFQKSASSHSYSQLPGLPTTLEVPCQRLWQIPSRVLHSLGDATCVAYIRTHGKGLQPYYVRLHMSIKIYIYIIVYVCMYVCIYILNQHDALSSVCFLFDFCSAIFQGVIWDHHRQRNGTKIRGTSPPFYIFLLGMDYRLVGITVQYTCWSPIFCDCQANVWIL